MAKTKTAPTADADPAAAPWTSMRRCIGSERFGIVAHEAPVADFPLQPSQKDGIGRMCKPHWREYTNGLRRDQLARQAAGAEAQPTPRDQAKAARSEASEAIANEARKGRAKRQEARAAAKATPAPSPTRPAKAPKVTAEPDDVRAARKLLAEVDTLGGTAYLEAISRDDVQNALRIMAGTAEGPAIHEAMGAKRELIEDRAMEATVAESAETFDSEGAGETPLGETFDSGTEEADARHDDSTDGSPFGM